MVKSKQKNKGVLNISSSKAQTPQPTKKNGMAIKKKTPQSEPHPKRKKLSEEISDDEFEKMIKAVKEEEERKKKTGKQSPKPKSPKIAGFEEDDDDDESDDDFDALEFDSDDDDDDSEDDDESDDDDDSEDDDEGMNEAETKASKKLAKKFKSMMEATGSDSDEDDDSDEEEDDSDDDDEDDADEMPPASKKSKNKPDNQSNMKKNSRKADSLDDEDSLPPAKKTKSQEKAAKKTEQLKKTTSSQEEGKGKKRKAENEPAVVNGKQQKVSEAQLAQDLDVQDERDNRTLFIKALPNQTTEEQVKELFEKSLRKDISEIRLRIKTNVKKVIKNKTFAYVEFESKEYVDKAYSSVKGKKIDGKEFVVDFVGTKSLNRPRPNVGKTNPDTYDPLRLYVTGFGRGTQLAELQKLFKGAKKVQLPSRRKNKKAVGYAFVHYGSEEACKKGHDSMHGKLLKDRRLVVLYAKKTTEAMKADNRPELLDAKEAKKKKQEQKKQKKTTAKDEDSSDEDDEEAAADTDNESDDGEGDSDEEDDSDDDDEEGDDDEEDDDDEDTGSE